MTSELIASLQYTILKIINTVAGKYKIILSSDDKQDLLQLVSLQLLLYPEDKLQPIIDNNKMPNLIYGIVKNQLVSATSDFYRQNRRSNNNISIEEIEDPYYEDKKFQ